MKRKEERVKTSTLKYVSKIIINSTDRLMRRHEIIKSDIALSFEYRRAVNSFHDDVTLAVRVLNGLPILDDSFLETGLLPDDPLNMYAYKSKLWDGRMSTEPVVSNVFKARFIMNMLLSIDANFDTIVSKELELIGRKKDNREAINLIYQIRDCIGNFIERLTDNKKYYRDEILKISELMVMADEDHFNKSKETLKTVSRELNRLDEMMNPGFLDGVRPNNDILIQNVCLLGYVMATGNNNVKNTFMVPEDINIKDIDAIKVLVEVLGKCIVERRVSDRPYPEIYRWYIQSLPKVYYKFKDINHNHYLAEGCRALSFINFYAGSKSISKLISKMIY